MSLRNILLFLSGMSALFACSPEPQAGKKTHWFRDCDVDADCAEQTSCFCGICSIECGTDADCGEGTCGSHIQTAGKCGDGARRICLPEDATACSSPVDIPYAFGGASGTDCDHSDALLCEDFDDGISSRYRVSSGDPGFITEQSCVAWGEGAALASQATANTFAELQMPLESSVDSGELHVRLRVYIPSGHDHQSYVTLLSLRPGPEFTPQAKVLRATPDGTLSFAFRSDGATASSEPNELPRDEWFCVELALDVAEQGTVSASIDGTEVISAEGETLPPTGALSAVTVFAGTGDLEEPADIAVDDLVVARTPIGCD